MFYFYGGGVRTPQAGAQVIASGADGIQVGNAFEDAKIGDKIKKFAEAIRKEGKKRI